MRKKTSNPKFNSGDDTFVTAETAARCLMFASELRQFINLTAIPSPALLASLLAQARFNPRVRQCSEDGRPAVLELFSDTTPGLIADNAGQLTGEARARVDTVFLNMLHSPCGFTPAGMVRQFQSITGLIRLGLVAISANALAALPDDVIHAAMMRHLSEKSGPIFPSQLSSTRTLFQDRFIVTLLRTGPDEMGPPEFVICTCLRENRTLIALWDELGLAGQIPTNDPGRN